MMLCLVISHGHARRELPLPSEGERLGSAPDNEIILRYPGVSRHHAEITRTAEGVALLDAGSKNGIVLNGRRVGSAPLVPGIRIELGEAMVTVEELSTSDILTGLRIEGETRTQSAGETDRRSPAESSGPAAAFQLVRELEGRDWAPELVVEAVRRVMAADSVFVGARVDEYVGVVALAGAIPDEAEIEQLASGSASTEVLGWLAANGSGERFIAARTADSSPWKREFLAFVGERILDCDLPTGKAISATLSIPDEMIIGPSAAMAQLMERIEQTVRSDLDVILRGETGTGKEVFARLIHASGPTSRGPFVAVNCAAIPAELMEAELFGVERRVATGVQPRRGLFREADRGTILLDEITEIPTRLQAKLLRVIQEREVLSVGASRPHALSLRIVSSTNKDIDQMVRDGGFRSDLLFRLRGLEFVIPPLRDRRDDIAALLLSFAARTSRRYGKQISGISRRALVELSAYSWPGNVRELKIAVERAVLLAGSGGTLQLRHFPGLIPDGERVSPSAIRPNASEPNRALLQSTLDDAERTAILDAISQCNGNKSEAARILSISRAALYLKMKRLKLGRSE